MFSALSKVVNYFWTEEDEEQPTSINYITDGIASNSNTSDVSAQSRNIDGKVTHLFDTHGLIDGEIYFSFDAILGDRKPRVGDNVTGVAKQQHTDGGWHAEQVLPCSDFWDQDDNDDDNGDDVARWDPDAVVGVITNFKGSEGLINDYIRFTFLPSDVGEDNFSPQPGDYVTADISKNEEGGTEGRNIQPLRVDEREGKITGALQNHGYVDGDIFFSYDACKEGYHPSQWDRVKVVAMESVQGKNSWRALSVEPISRSYTPSAKFLVSPTGFSFLEDLQRDKKGIVVSMNTDFGEVFIGQKKRITIWIENKGKSPQCFQRCHFPTDATQLQVESVKFLREHTAMMATGNQSVIGEVNLYPASSLYVNIVLDPRSVGSEKQLLVCIFKGFRIGRYITANISDEYLDMVSRGPQYTQQRRNAKSRYMESANNPGWTVPGVRPTRSGRILPHRLPMFSVPKRFRECVLDGDIDSLMDIVPELDQELTFENYTAWFKALLYLEEIQMDIDIRQFDLSRVIFRPVHKYLALKVPGLAEGRPSVLIGDKIIAREPGDGNRPEYEGYVQELMSEEVLLTFHGDFHLTNNGKDFDVVFSISRGPIRRCHQAATLAVNLGTDVLFPNKLIPQLSQLLTPNRTRGRASVVPHNTRHRADKGGPKMSFYNQRLNNKQRAAVVRILQGQCRPLPYILFGPPGTGKTMTVVESVLQILKSMSSSRILVCAPSNSAVDLVAELLHNSGQVKTSDMVRLNAFQRNEETLPDCLRPYSSNREDLENDLGLASHYRVVLSTCSTAGQLYNLGIKSGHFSHVFIDEAGQATEPENMIPCCMVSGSNGQIILSGDPNQLGPVIQSKLARKYGLELSYLERLINMPLYQRNESMFADHGCYDPLLVTKLVDNYRSHQAILTLPSRLFYHGELRECANRQMTHAFCGWVMLLNKEFPVLFHGVRGEDTREGDSPSWFNPMETVQVVRYLQALMRDEKYQLLAEDVGIITPYRKQVEKIRLLIDKLGIAKVKVGSVEEFQGQQRSIIIISTVRANEKLIGFDLKHTLGFLSNPKRFNVSISRAKSLLIVIGNPFVLAQDKYWQTLIHYCIENNAYTGCDLPDLSDLEVTDQGQGHQNGNDNQVHVTDSTDNHSVTS